ncbi:serpin family protein [Paenibacillus sp. UMB7766-LJ446]|uniref:serpin family protein n=1 Tax=Paenibacillus sp. UMB7766-LJ446 TaxID=3046313 RepID=UPI00254EBA9D|nr:serpin family protein [Paenibacillus sp. UMB7766-LJ446]MDK8190264.1 serpin family protein [Paenibacillus sp. UMB7766-LJ446]
MQFNSDQELSESERNAALKENEPERIQAMNTMGLHILQQMSAKEKGDGNNLLISPYSISAAIGMAYNGSVGETRQEMAEVMGWSGLEMERVNASQAALQQLLTHPGNGIEIGIANSMWMKDGIPVEETYKTTIQQAYEAELRTLNGQPTQAKEEINQWVKQHTEGMIPNLMQEPPEKEALMILVNAIAFDGNWMDEFDPEYTTDDEFKLANGKALSVRMMHQKKQFQYSENEDWQAVRLPYGEGQMHLLVVLPREGRTLDQVQQQLLDAPKRLDAGSEYRLVELSLPLFRAEYGVNLRETLQQMGMEMAFDPYAANFTGMISPGPNLQAYIGQIQHRAVMEVNEQGTVAAAATMVGMEAGSAPPTDPVKMNVNRPFMVAVVDEATGAWVFAGSIYNPEPLEEN